MTGKDKKFDAHSLINNWIIKRNEEFLMVSEMSRSWFEADNEFGKIIAYYALEKRLDEFLDFTMDKLVDEMYQLNEYDPDDGDSVDPEFLLQKDVMEMLENLTFQKDNTVFTQEILAIPYFGSHSSINHILSIDNLTDPFFESEMLHPSSKIVCLGAVPIDIAQLHLLSNQSLFDAQQHLVSYFQVNNKKSLEMAKKTLNINDDHFGKDSNITGQYLFLFASQINESLSFYDTQAKKNQTSDFNPQSDCWEDFSVSLKNLLEKHTHSKTIQNEDEDIFGGFDHPDYLSESIAPALAAWIISQFVLQNSIDKNNSSEDKMDIKKLEVYLPDDESFDDCANANIYAYKENNELIGCVQTNALCLVIGASDIFEFMESIIEGVSIQVHTQPAQITSKKHKRMLN